MSVVFFTFVAFWLKIMTKEQNISTKIKCSHGCLGFALRTESVNDILCQSLSYVGFLYHRQES